VARRNLVTTETEWYSPLKEEGENLDRRNEDGAPMKRLAALVALMLVVVALPRAQGPIEKLDYVTIGKIRD
jgi:hypothetical protein